MKIPSTILVVCLWISIVWSVFLCTMLQAQTPEPTSPSISSIAVNSLFQRNPKLTYERRLLNYNKKLVDKKVKLVINTTNKSLKSHLLFQPPLDWEKKQLNDVGQPYQKLASMLQQLSENDNPLIFSKTFKTNATSRLEQQTLLMTFSLSDEVAMAIVEHFEFSYQQKDKAKPQYVDIKRQNVLINNQRVIEIKLKDPFMVGFLFLLAATPKLQKNDKQVFFVGYFIPRQRFTNEIEGVLSSISSITKKEPNFIVRFISGVRKKLGMQ